jgi:hypothetical protein
VNEYSESSELATELALEDLGDHTPSWFRGVAFTTLGFSVLASIAALLAGMTAHEIILERTEEIVAVTDRDADLITAEVLRSKHEVQIALGVTPDAEEVEEIATLEAEAAAEDAEAAAGEAAVREYSSEHLVFALAATIFAVAIAITGLSAIVRQRWLWGAGIVMGISAGAILAAGAVWMFS